MKLAELSEAQSVSHLCESFPRDERTMIGIGDDCAQVAAPGGSFIATMDVMVEDQYFHLLRSTGYEVGVRVAAQNLADIDAMGGRLSAFVASVVAPRDMDSGIFPDAVRGLGGRTCEVGTGVVDGDLSTGEELVISIMASGYYPGPMMCHDGACSGDTVAVSGTLGYSHVGLDLLEDGYVDPFSREAEQLGELAPFIETYRAPRPPLGSGMAAAAAGARAMMNLPDGSVTDTGRITQASGIVVEFNRDVIEAEASQLVPAARACAVDSVWWVLRGGEGHGMIAVFSPNALLPDGSRVVGGVQACRLDEEPQATMDEAALRGAWGHFPADSVD